MVRISVIATLNQISSYSYISSYRGVQLLFKFHSAVASMHIVKIKYYAVLIAKCKCATTCEKCNCMGCMYSGNI